MKTYKAEFYSGAKMTVKAKDFFAARARIDAIIRSARNTPVLFSLVLVD